MSKSTIKKLLQSMTKAEIIEMVLELYSARKEAKEYLEFYVCPDEKGKLEEYKSIIREEFYPKRRREPQTRFSVCRKAVADFKKLKPSADALAELMVSYMEWATQFTYDYGDMWEQYYDSVESNFDKTVKHIAANGLWEKYDKRLQQCVKWSEGNGYGFADAVADMYEEGKAIDHELATKYPTTRMSEAEIKICSANELSYCNLRLQYGLPISVMRYRHTISFHKAITICARKSTQDVLTLWNNIIGR